MDFVSKKINFSKSKKVSLIGEIGVNHNKNLNLLFKLIDEGINSGVDIIKLQRFNSSLEISKFAPTTNYQKKNSKIKNQLQLAKKLELPDEWIVKAFNYCKKKGVGFLCAAFDEESVDFISKKLKCKTVKSPSSEINNYPLLRRMAREFESVIVSTGASSMSDCIKAKKNILNENEKTKLLFMHCVSEYPAPIEDSNLNSIINMKKKLKVPIGFSDHTSDIIAPILSVQNGCILIEKHFTLDKGMKGPDHKASLEPEQLKKLSQILKSYESIMGDGKKKPQISELKNKNLIRKSAVCSQKYIEKGTVITNEHITFKRPFIENAYGPNNYLKILGKKIKKKILFDQPYLKKLF